MNDLVSAFPNPLYFPTPNWLSAVGYVRYADHANQPKHTTNASTMRERSVAVLRRHAMISGNQAAAKNAAAIASENAFTQASAHNATASRIPAPRRSCTAVTRTSMKNDST